MHFTVVELHRAHSQLPQSIKGDISFVSMNFWHFGHVMIGYLKIRLVSPHSSPPLYNTVVLGYPLEAYKKNALFRDFRISQFHNYASKIITFAAGFLVPRPPALQLEHVRPVEVPLPKPVTPCLHNLDDTDQVIPVFMCPLNELVIWHKQSASDWPWGSVRPGGSAAATDISWGEALVAYSFWTSGLGTAGEPDADISFGVFNSSVGAIRLGFSG